MKKLIIAAAIAALTFTGAASAATAKAKHQMPNQHKGFYIGFGVGMSHQSGGTYGDSKSLNGTDLSVNSNKSLAGRVYVGYDFMKYFGVEFGATKFSNVTGSTSTKNSRASMSSFDAMLVASVPLYKSGFALHAKVGGAYTSTELTYLSANNSSTADANKLRLAFGLGASYVLSKNVSVHADWTRIAHADAKSSNPVIGDISLPTADLFTLGLKIKL